MSDFNLIDTSYRRRINIKRWLLGAVVAYVVLLIGLFGARASLNGYIDKARAEVAALRSDTESILSRKRSLREIQSEKSKLERKLKVLGGLVEGPDINRIFHAVERSLNDETWFVDWSFRRAGELIDVNAEEIDTGYFIIVSEQTDAQKQAWKIKTHMEINAQAINHSALASFVRKLSNQPEVDHVQIESTHTRNVGAVEVIHFNLGVLINTQQKAGA